MNRKQLKKFGSVISFVCIGVSGLTLAAGCTSNRYDGYNGSSEREPYQSGSPVNAASDTEYPSDTTSTMNGAAAQAEGSENDREITAAVRRAIVNDDSISTQGQNVTIVTRAGVVKLSGAVKSPMEKAKIETYARQIAGASVDNRLFVQ